MDSLKLLRLPTLVLLAICLAGCGDDGTVAPRAEPVDFDAVAQGRNARFDDLTETRIRDAETWQTVRPSLRPVGTIENVDFSNREVLLVAMPVTSGGYDLEFERIDRLEEGIRAYYIVHEPGEDCMTAQVMLTPFAAVSVERTDEDITFHPRTLRYSCGVRQN
jgi:hypothetical protein